MRATYPGHPHRPQCGFDSSVHALLASRHVQSVSSMRALTKLRLRHCLGGREDSSHHLLQIQQLQQQEEEVRACTALLLVEIVLEEGRTGGLHERLLEQRVLLLQWRTRMSMRLSMRKYKLECASVRALVCENLTDGGAELTFDACLGDRPFRSRAAERAKAPAL